MKRDAPARAGATYVDLEFDTGTRGAALLGDIAASLVCLDELLRDLGSIAAYPSSVEHRTVEIVAIDMQSPLTIRLSLAGIPPEAVKTFEAICREIILFGQRGDERLTDVDTILERAVPRGEHSPVTSQEVTRLHGHVAALQNAAIRLRRVEVAEPGRPKAAGRRTRTR